MAEDLDVLAILERRLARERAARMEAERLLEEKSEALYHSLTRAEASESLLQSAIDSMADGLLLASREGKIVLSNRLLGKIYPTLADRIQPGRTMGAEFDFLLQCTEYAQVTAGVSEGGQTELVLDDGRTISIVVGVTHEGHIASTHREVTADKRAEAERRKLLLDLARAQRLEAIGRMTGMIAHDFNNINAAIGGFASFLVDDLPADSANGKLASRIVSASERADALIGEILEYGNRQQAPSHVVPLIPLLEDCADMLLSDVPPAVQLHIEAPDVPIWVRGSEKAFSRLFTNLLKNSVRALADTAGEISVQVAAFSNMELRSAQYKDARLGELNGASNLYGRDSFPDPCVNVTITDTGCGISPAVMSRIFEMFYTTRPKGTPGGIGMSSVADVLLDCDAGVRIDSTEGIGTAVQVVLDRVDGPAAVIPG